MAKETTRKEDRRVTYTKNAIKDALLDALRHKPFEKLSISAVCADAQITRTTFYTHYENLNQVLDELICEAFEVAAESASSVRLSFPERMVYLTRFNTAEELRAHNGDLPTCQRIADTPKYRILFQDGTISDYIQNKLFLMLKPTVVPELAEYCLISPQEAEAMFRYFLSGSYALNSALGWIKDDRWFSMRLHVIHLEAAGLEAIRQRNLKTGGNG